MEDYEETTALQAIQLQMVQALSDGHEKWLEFGGEMFDKMQNEDDKLNKIVFSDKTTFHLSGKVNRHNVRIWGTKNPHEIVEHMRDSPKLNASVL
jgi:hypothetical protein